jgi:hypothetical protein
LFSTTDAREKSRGRKLSKSSKRSKSEQSLKVRESVRKSVDKLTDIPSSSPASEAGKENMGSGTDRFPKEQRKRSIFSHLGKVDDDFVDRILKVHVHGADELITDINVRNPLVRVSIIGRIRCGNLSRYKDWKVCCKE